MDKLVNLRKTLGELKKFLSRPIEDERDVAGIIQAFEFTFEQSWMAIQKFAASHGVDIGNPKAAFAYAMQNKWIPIPDEQRWLDLIKDRNLTSHTYEQNLAQEVLGRIQGQYLDMFEYLLKALEKSAP